MSKDYFEFLTGNIILESSIESFKNGNPLDFFEKLSLKLQKYLNFNGWTVLDLRKNGPKFLAFSKKYRTLNFKELSEKMSDREKLLYMKVKSSKKWEYIKNLQKNSIWIPRGSFVYSWIGVPLIFKDREPLILNLDYFSVKKLSKKEKNLLDKFQENFVIYSYKISDIKNIFNQQYIDPLTGLKNRQFLMDYLNSQNLSEKIGVIFCDLDKFKQVNDKYGHSTGDEVLIIVAKRLKNIIKSTDEVIRFGGDEFVILTKSVNGIGKIIERIKHFIGEREIHLDDIKIEVGVSCGYAIYPDESENFEKIIHIADMRMFKNKMEQ
ncbi:MAG: diguanylate cyclase [Thermosipho sp. (in: thermotogales)]|nr:diguanylate cyclase [Thermosipho sp. (in: thermotogales)]